MNNSVVFAGFTATSLATRIVDAQAKLVIAVDVGMRAANRVPGTSYELDPVQAAFNIGAMVRWIDFNDTWLAAEWGRPSDNLGGILAVADCLSRKRIREGEKPITVRDLLLAMIQAYEIQGVLSLENGFNRFCLDHVLLVRIAWTAVITRLLGGTRQDVINALSNAFIDGATLRVYRHAPKTGSRKSWAAGDATSRAVLLAFHALRAKRSIGNSVQVFFKDGSHTEPVTVEYPIGHRRPRKEGVPALLDKFEQNLRGRMPARKADAILKLFCDRAHLEPPPWIA